MKNFLDDKNASYDTLAKNFCCVKRFWHEFIQYLFGMHSMRQTIKEIEVNVAVVHRLFTYRTRASFAYSSQTACDKHGFVLDFELVAGNVHDSQSFHQLYGKLALKPRAS